MYCPCPAPTSGGVGGNATETLSYWMGKSSKRSELRTSNWLVHFECPSSFPSPPHLLAKSGLPCPDLKAKWEDHEEKSF